jgi:hypothetical protein
LITLAGGPQGISGSSRNIRAGFAQDFYAAQVFLNPTASELSFTNLRPVVSLLTIIDLPD